VSKDAVEIAFDNVAQAFQFKAQRPFVQGFNFLVGYNYNRAKNDETYDGVDVFLDNLTLQDSPNNRHKFNAGGIYEIPFGKGRKYMSSMNKVQPVRRTF